MQPQRHDHYREKTAIDDRGDTVIVNRRYLFVRDDMLGDYYFSYRGNGDVTAVTRACERRARDHKPLLFNFYATKRAIAYDTIPDNRNTSMVRYEGVITPE